VPAIVSIAAPILTGITDFSNFAGRSGSAESGSFATDAD